MDDLPELRATVPALEPDPVLLGQLVELSAASTAAVGRRPLRPVRALSVGAAAFGLVAATSWFAGALPGVPSPLAPEQAPTPTPTAPATPGRSSDVRVPGADVDPTSGASRPHTEAPGVVPTTGPGSPTATPSDRPSATPSPGRGTPVPGHGPSEHADNGQHRGRHRGHRGRPQPHPTAKPPRTDPTSPSATPTVEPTSRPTSGDTIGP